jgi:shikimate dehydrogenase
MQLALLGDPVEHSRSPAIHAAALKAVGLEGEYVARRSDVSGVAAAVAEMRTGALDGANVTMPLKAAALDAVDSASVEAIRAGAVNTLFLHDGAVRGENTDIGGLQDVARSSEQSEHAPILVLGAGGAAGAVLVAFDDRDVVLSARRTEAAERLAAIAGVDIRIVEWGAGLDGSIVVNSTPLGMRGEVLPEAVLAGAGGLIDLAYGDETTPAVAVLRGRVPVADGIDHLVAQADRSFTLWTGVRAPREALIRAARAR